MAVPAEWFEIGGIKEGYPRLRRRFGRFVDYIALLRPFTLVAPVVAGFSVSFICLGSDVWSQWLKVVYVTFTLALCQAVGQVVNQATGVEEDRINKPYRPIPSGRVSVEEAYGVAFLLTLAALWRGFTVKVTFGFWITLVLFFALFYNLKPVEARRRVWVNLLWMSISRGLLPFVVVWSAYRSPFELKPWLLGSIAFLWVFAFQPTKDIPDVRGDAIYGIRTLPVVYGVGWTETFIKYTSLLPFVPLVVYVWRGILPSTYLLLLSVVVVREIGVRGLRKEAPVTENTLGWMMFYVGLGLIFVLSLVAEFLS